MTNSDKRPDPILYADGARGTTIPSYFATTINRDWLIGVGLGDLAILSAGDSGMCPECARGTGLEPDDTCTVCDESGQIDPCVYDATWDDTLDNALVIVEDPIGRLPRRSDDRATYLAALQGDDPAAADRVLRGVDTRPTADVLRDMYADWTDQQRIEPLCAAAGIVLARLHQDGDLWLVPTGMEWDDATEWYFWPTPMAIRLDNADHDDGMVTIYCDSQPQARLDQSIDGSRWECPRDMGIAYATTTDRPSLVAELEAEGYIVDTSEYSAPDDADVAEWSRRCDCHGTSESCSEECTEECTEA